MSVIVEIRAAEGGDDAKMLVLDQYSIYQKLAVRESVTVEVLERLPSMLSFRASGKQAAVLFGDEAGGHRWQRVPPNEKRGRTHTSTVTVAVLPEPSATELVIDARDVDVMVARGSGPGGQHRNKTESCVTLRHRPSGITVKCETDRSQHRNRETAQALLRARLWDAQQIRQGEHRSDVRRLQVGSGMRGDKRRTIRMQDGQVHDHVTGRRWDLRKYLRGEWF